MRLLAWNGDMVFICALDCASLLFDVPHHLQLSPCRFTHKNAQDSATAGYAKSGVFLRGVR